MNRRNFLRLLGAGAAVVAVRPVIEVQHAFELPPPPPAPAIITPEMEGFWHNWSVHAVREIIETTGFDADYRSLKPGAWMDVYFQGETYHPIDVSYESALVDIPTPQGRMRLLVRPTSLSQHARTDERPIWAVEGEVLSGQIQFPSGETRYFGKQLYIPKGGSPLILEA